MPPFCIPELTARNDADHQLGNANTAVLVYLSLEQLLAKHRLLISSGTIERTPPVLLFAVKRLIEQKRYHFGERHLMSFVWDILPKTSYAEDFVVSEGGDVQQQETIFLLRH